ncbi:indolepyruvate oxidoreductase subunit beta family protein [Xenorhabdus sp. BG5]|uniref:indolepyruvate oxidoreductase subunit beta family protein n=1 Tax=Xenorhabdus sp. BG5 TaxID=2782014 RepID=UPI00187E53A5|nr:indolepyruvate oxidoreductase subunit beta family protein [Xenorhabdus sp. BG5]MBE8596205.1 indolepyruvate oxidoreductase subunit beta family protein [Xenorhabdus sp. BG5]
MPPSIHSPLTNSPKQPIKIAILATGGEGGGVLADWIVTLGEEHGYFAQTTSVPGVAQRTGATIYYVELFPGADDPEVPTPVLALMPTAGDVDIVLASELMEAGRAVQRGLVTADRTTLIASSHRVFSMEERSAMGDGRVDSEVLIQQSRQAALRFIHFDMAKMAEKSGSVISAVLFGALCGTEILPFSRNQFEAAIIKKNVGIKPSLQAFSLGLGRTQWEAESKIAPELHIPQKAQRSHHRFSHSNFSHNCFSHNHKVNALLLRIRQKLPACVHGIAIEGARRLIDYQDPAYASLYLDRLQRLIEQAVKPDERLLNEQLLRETARHLALWMAYEDTMRVADLKIRASRFERVRKEMRVKNGQLFEINDFLHPRMEEVCDSLPANIGRWLSRPHFVNRMLATLLSRGYVITSSSLRGYLLLYILASWRRMRRHTLRFQHETARIEEWLQRIGVTATRDPELATEIAQCQRLIKGYGDTHSRGSRHFQTLMAIVDHHLHDLPPASLRQLREAALADEQGDRLRECQQRLSLY